MALMGKTEEDWNELKLGFLPGEGGGGVLPQKGLMGRRSQTGCVFRDFCLKQGIDVIIFLS